MTTHRSRREVAYHSGLSLSVLTRLLSWLVLCVPLTIAGFAAAQPAEVAPPATGEVDAAFEFDAPAPPAPPASTAAPASPAAPAPPAAADHPLATFLGDEKVAFDTVASDLFAAGKIVEITGLVTGNAFVAGQLVELEHGRIAGDLFTAGETVTLEQEVGSDLYIVGGACRIERDAVVTGNVYVGCGDVVVEGTVGGSIVGGGGEVTLDGPVGGDVELETGAIKIGPGAEIRGDLTYRAPDEAQIDGGAVIGGTVDFTRAEDYEEGGCHAEHHEQHQGPGFFGFWLGHTWSFLGALVVGFVLIALLGATARRPVAALLDEPGKSLGIGFVLLFAVPIGAVIAIALILSLPLGVITLMLYGVAVYVAALIPAMALGRMILERSFGKDDPSPYAALALGLVILHLLFAIPIFGFLIHVVAASAGLGAMFRLAGGGAGPDPAQA